MKICHSIDHPNLNGGIFSICEIINGLKKYNNLQTELAIVNRTGTSATTRLDILDYYKITPIGYFTPENFSDISKNYDFIIQHRLHGTKPLLHKNIIIVNHTSQATEELSRFKDSLHFISVSGHIDKITKYPHKRKTIIKNGMEPRLISSPLSDVFITGRCHRLQKSILENSIPILKNIKQHKHIVIGKHKKLIDGNIEYTDEIVDINEKMKIISSFDLTFYDVNYGEGTSMSVLESLSVGVPVLARNQGGTNEIIVDNINGHFFNNYIESNKYIYSYINNRESLYSLKEKTRQHFEKHNHIKFTSQKYYDLLSSF